MNISMTRIKHLLESSDCALDAISVFTVTFELDSLRVFILYFDLHITFYLISEADRTQLSKVNTRIFQLFGTCLITLEHRIFDLTHLLSNTFWLLTAIVSVDWGIYEIFATIFVLLSLLDVISVGMPLLALLTYEADQTTPIIVFDIIITLGAAKTIIVSRIISDKLML